LHCAEYFFFIKVQQLHRWKQWCNFSAAESAAKRKAQRFWQPLRCAEGSGSARCAIAFLAKEKAGSRYFQR
jgi:hypothetical protein